ASAWCSTARAGGSAGPDARLAEPSPRSPVAAVDRVAPGRLYREAAAAQVDRVQVLPGALVAVLLAVGVEPAAAGVRVGDRLQELVPAGDAEPVQRPLYRVGAAAAPRVEHVGLICARDAVGDRVPGAEPGARGVEAVGMGTVRAQHHDLQVDVRSEEHTSELQSPCN